jgi:hypothetical protein
VLYVTVFASSFNTRTSTSSSPATHAQSCNALHSPALPCLAITHGRHRCALRLTRNLPRAAVQGCVLGPLCAGPHGSNRHRRDHRRAFLQVRPSVVGLAGLEPAPSSLSAITRSPLCRPAFSQVVRDRRGSSNALLRSRPAQRTDRPPRPRDKLEDQPRCRQGDGAAGWARQPHRTGSSVLLGGAGQGRSLGWRVP